MEKVSASSAEASHGFMISSTKKRCHISTNDTQRIDENVDEGSVFEEEMTLMKNLEHCLNEGVMKDDP